MIVSELSLDCYPGIGEKMSQNVEMGGAGSLTIGVLVAAVIFLMRSFYKRYSRMDKARQAAERSDVEEQ